MLNPKLPDQSNPIGSTMTLDQLRIFVEVAERGCIDRAAIQLQLPRLKVRDSVRTIENCYGISLFDRSNKKLEMTDAGRKFLIEAKRTLASAAATEMILAELSSLKRGVLRLKASQTIGSYWLPSLLVDFQKNNPGIAVELTEGGTLDVEKAVLLGNSDLGFVEGTVNDPMLCSQEIAQDKLIIVAAPGHFCAGKKIDGKILSSFQWITREFGFGTMSHFISALKGESIDASALNVVMTLPSNEAMFHAVANSEFAAVVSELAVAPLLKNGKLIKLNFELPNRTFKLISHQVSFRTDASYALETYLLSLNEPSKKTVATYSTESVG